MVTVHTAPPAAAHGPLPTDPRSRPLGATALAVAGALFFAYPALRPYADESTLGGAAAMSSTAWVASHLFGVAAFVLVAFGLIRTSLPGRSGRVATVSAWLGTVLVLPYYGAETFGLQVIAQRALDDGDASLLTLAEDLRLGAVPVTMFGAGLLALAVAGVALVVATWRGGPLPRLAGLLAGAGLALYLPQFFAAPALRIGHGVLLGAGLLLLAATTWRGRHDPAPR